MNKPQSFLISRYIQAKDHSKPHLMSMVFAPDAVLTMQVNSENITFPAEVVGVEAITHTLVTEFNQRYQNIYTLCLSDTVKNERDHLSCRWLVGMTDKASGECRFGFGDYDWVFDGSSRLVSQLTIRIDEMRILPAQASNLLLGWLASQHYPWVSSAELLASWPALESLKGVDAVLC